MTETLTKTVEINLDNVLPMLRQAVDAKGDDYVYRNEFNVCEYGDTLDDVVHPKCVVGQLVYQQAGEQALSRAGDYTNALDLFGFEGGGYQPDDEWSVKEYARNVKPTKNHLGLKGFDVTREAVVVLVVAQGVQDAQFPRRHSWGEAYAAAEEAHAALVAKRDAQ